MDIEGSRELLHERHPGIRAALEEALPINEYGEMDRVSDYRNDHYLANTLSTLYSEECEGLFFASSREYVVFPGSISTHVIVVSHRRSTYPPDVRLEKKRMLSH